MPGAPRQLEPQDLESGKGEGSGDAARIIELRTGRARPPAVPRRSDERFGIVAGLVVVALLGAMTIWTLHASRERPARSVNPASGQALGVPPDMPLSGLPDGHELEIDIPGPGGGDPASSLAPPNQSPILANPPFVDEASEVTEPALRPSPPENSRANPTVVFQSGEDGSGVDFAFEGASSDTIAVVPKNRPAAPNQKTAARPLPSSPNAWTVGRGTLIPAILETAIDSNVSGGVRAIVSADVLASDGKRALVPRSSRLIGQYKSRKSAGQQSAHVVWTQIIRPDGVRITIPSTAAGASERQFFERFGSARLVSVIAGQTGADLRARQGEPVRIMAARDIDLSKGR